MTNVWRDCAEETSMNKLVRRVLPSLVLLSLLLLPAAAMAQALPPVAGFVQNLDVRCYKIPNQVPINLPLQLDHLNPLFIEKGFPKENVIVKEPQNLCVPVAKNGNFPPQGVLPFIRFVDWKCYGIQGPSLDYPLHVDHLNPVIRQMFGPGDDIIVREPQQLCVPVMKNNSAPPAAVRELVQWLDVKCYRVESTYPAGGAITLNHLNPLFAGFPAENTQITGPAKQLCVPVAKNNVMPPAVESTVAWMRSPTATSSWPSSFFSSLRSIVASPLAPTFTNATSAPIATICPSIAWPLLNRLVCSDAANNAAKSSS
jgi:hypothetical protein